MPDFLRWVLRRTTCRQGAGWWQPGTGGWRAPQHWRKLTELLPASHATSSGMASTAALSIGNAIGSKPGLSYTHMGQVRAEMHTRPRQQVIPQLWSDWAGPRVPG